MKLLDKDASEDDVPVTRADQDNINMFSRLNTRMDDVVEELDRVKKELEDIEEVETEIELMDDDENVMYKLDSTFLHLPASSALSVLQDSLTKLRERSEVLEKEKEECEEGMVRLKGLLYAKFGSSINLERD